MDADKPHVVDGVVIDGSPGWGIVNHHAYAEVSNSITYNVLGAGFVAEGGNERGEFSNCFALQSEGSGEVIDARAHGAHGGDPNIDDFGHAGHGFWLQSPLVDVVNNVAAGHRHQAFVWWLRPLLDTVDETQAECSHVEDSRVAFCPNVPIEYVDMDQIAPLWEAIRVGRFSSNHDDLMQKTEKIPSTFAPLANISGNVAFCSGGGFDFSRHNFKWKHERFSDFNTLSDFTIYNIGRFKDSDGEEHSPSLPRHRSSGHQGRGGNVGASFRYTSNVRLSGASIVGSGAKNSVGIPYHDYLWTTLFEDSTIENWDWGVDTGEHRLTWVRNNTFANNTYDINWSFDNAGPAIIDDNTLDNIRYKFQYVNEKASDVLLPYQSRGVRVDGKTAYVDSSTPEFVPFPDSDALSGVNNIEDIDTVDNQNDLVGLTNSELRDEYGVCIGGYLQPDTARSVDYFENATVADNPGSVTISAQSGNISGGWEPTDDPDASSCLRSTDSSGSVSYTFSCDSGRYRVHLRCRPSSWNGDDISVTVDGSEYIAEKIKSPIGFEWHSVSPNNEDPYEIDMSEGEHTLTLSTDNIGILVDQIFVVSDGTVIGAHSQ
jgi:hypothetical protein